MFLLGNLALALAGQSCELGNLMGRGGGPTKLPLRKASTIEIAKLPQLQSFDDDDTKLHIFHKEWINHPSFAANFPTENRGRVINSERLRIN